MRPYPLPADFLRALPIAIGYEGGKVDNPKDKGGRTNRGVTQRAYDAWRKRRARPGEDVDAKGQLLPLDVWLMPDEDLAPFYYEGYWLPSGADELVWPLSLVVFDSAVLHGPARARQWVRETKSGREEPSPTDAARRILDRRLAHVEGIVKKDTAQRVFLKGWVSRINQLAHVSGVA